MEDCCAAQALAILTSHRPGWIMADLSQNLDRMPFVTKGNAFPCITSAAYGCECLAQVATLLQVCTKAQWAILPARFGTRCSRRFWWNVFWWNRILVKLWGNITSRPWEDDLDELPGECPQIGQAIGQRSASLVEFSFFQSVLQLNVLRITFKHGPYNSHLPGHQLAGVQIASHWLPACWHPGGIWLPACWLPKRLLLPVCYCHLPGVGPHGWQCHAPSSGRCGYGCSTQGLQLAASWTGTKTTSNFLLGAQAVDMMKFGSFLKACRGDKNPHWQTSTTFRVIMIDKIIISNPHLFFFGRLLKLPEARMVPLPCLLPAFMPKFVRGFNHQSMANQRWHDHDSWQQPRTIATFVDWGPNYSCYPLCPALLLWRRRWKRMSNLMMRRWKMRSRKLQGTWFGNALGRWYPQTLYCKLCHALDRF